MSMAEVAVGLDYETELPWVYTGDTARGMVGDGVRFYLATVPAELARRFDDARRELDAVVDAIHEAADFDRDNNRLREPCAAYEGEPIHLPRGTVYDDCDACGWPREQHPS